MKIYTLIGSVTGCGKSSLTGGAANHEMTRRANVSILDTSRRLHGGDRPCRKSIPG